MSDILSKREIEQFILNGFVRIDHAFPQHIADEVVAILWNDLPCVRSNPSTWTEPVIRLGMYNQQPFIESLDTERLVMAYNQLIGENKWIPVQSVGTFPVRFPSEKQPSDTGKHVDAGFPGKDPHNYFQWRVNAKSKGRALLILALYSDVRENDAPTIICQGSHIDVASLLSQKDDSGLSFMELASKLAELPDRKETHAIGKAGTVYLCHPFLIHSAQPHRGINPKFMAQPPLLLRDELTISGSDAGYTPVERAIRLGLR